MNEVLTNGKQLVELVVAIYNGVMPYVTPFQDALIALVLIAIALWLLLGVTQRSSNNTATRYYSLHSEYTTGKQRK